MPKPYRDLSPLDVSDDDIEAQRQQALMQPGRDAVEGIYPETFLVPAARGLKALLTPKQPTRLEALYNKPMPQEAIDLQKSFPPETFERAGKYLQKEAAKKAQMQKYVTDYIRNKNADRFREQARQKQAEAPQKATERATKDAVEKAEYNQIFEDSNQYKRGGQVKGYAKGGSVSSASTRADGCAQRGKTRGKMVRHG